MDVHPFILFIYCYLALHLEKNHKFTKVGKDFKDHQVQPSYKVHKTIKAF